MKNLQSKVCDEQKFVEPPNWNIKTNATKRVRLLRKKLIKKVLVARESILTSENLLKKFKLFAPNLSNAFKWPFVARFSATVSDPRPLQICESR